MSPGFEVVRYELDLATEAAVNWFAALGTMTAIEPQASWSSHSSVVAKRSTRIDQAATSSSNG
ncbi:MAG: hypothetical protein M3Y35_08920, partial [Actinomycetota bacterium]|nr:hypothetical protein [Actinomycetota bacterium]